MNRNNRNINQIIIHCTYAFANESNANAATKALSKSHQANAQRHSNMDRQQHDRKEARTGNT